MDYHYVRMLFEMFFIVSFTVCIRSLLRSPVLVKPEASRSIWKKQRKWLPLLLSLLLCSFYVETQGTAGHAIIQLGRDAYINIGAFTSMLFYILVALVAIKAAVLTGLIANLPQVKFAAKETDESIRNRVQAFWDSKEFLTCLKTALPRGEKDDRDGLDYIPYMLQNVELRRERYERSASRFLTITIAFTLVFSVIIVSFGYILIDDKSTGLPNAVYKLELMLGEAENDSKSLLVQFWGTPEFDRTVGETIRAIERFQGSESINKIRQGLSGDIWEAKQTGNLRILLPQLSKASAALRGETDNRKAEFDNLLDKLTEGLRGIVAREDLLPVKYNKVVQEAKTVTEAISKYADTAAQKNYELWRRLGLGVLVSTFFFVVIRYFASLYKQEHIEVLRAEQDDLALRQFVVALRGSGEDFASRRNTLAALSSRCSWNQAGENKNEFTNVEASVLKELISAVMKKLP